MARTKVPSSTPRPIQKARKTITASAIRSLAVTKETSKRRRKQINPEKRNRKKNYVSRALKEIKNYQNSTRLLVPRAPVVRCIKETIQNGNFKNFRVTTGAVEAIREAIEAYLVEMFEICNLFAIHAKRVTVMPKDVHLWKKVGKMMNV